MLKQWNTWHLNDPIDAERIEKAVSGVFMAAHVAKQKKRKEEAQAQAIAAAAAGAGDGDA